jgi:hypothetical protein
MSANYTLTIPFWLDLLFVWPILLYRLCKFGYAYRRIYLGEGEWAIVDPQDYYWLGKFKWIFWGGGRNPYAVREVKIEPKKTKRVYLHRAIMKAPKRRLVDHRNGDGLDNRRANLRLATHSQNAINRPKRKSKTSSKYRGVFFSKPRGKWGAVIRLHYKQKWLGVFKNEIDAARAYDTAAIKYHKEFARLNFPQDKAGACPP